MFRRGRLIWKSFGALLVSYLLLSPLKAKEAEGEKTQERDPADTTLLEQAFKSAATVAMPLTPEHIAEIQKNLLHLQRAASDPSEREPEFLSHLQNVSIDPGAPIPEIFVEMGYVSTLSIIDASGQAWPIKEYIIGNPKQFDIQGPLSEGHILTISPLSKYGSSNLSVTLEGLATPLTFVLRSGKAKVHTRYDARLSKMGPFAKHPLIQNAPNYFASDEIIMAFLQGVPPIGAQKYTVHDPSKTVKAWEHQGKMYVRSPYVLLSPAPEARVSSSDGMSVYRLAPIPVLVFSNEGVVLKVTIDAKKEMD